MTINKKCIPLVGGIVGGIAVIIILYKLYSTFRLKFKDRNGAASILGKVLRDRVKNIREFQGDKQKITILGIPRGGVLVADIVAREFCADFDIVVSMKLGCPDNKENAFGAISEDGAMYLDNLEISRLKISKEYIENEIADMKEVMSRKIAFYRGEIKRPSLIGQSVILVDDGAATGSTLIAAARSIQKENPKHLIIATPVAPRKTIKLLKREAEIVEVISSPSSSDFITVGQFYQEFSGVSDEKVTEIMSTRNILPT
jgi:putative phosphoribosyl transferase